MNQISTRHIRLVGALTLALLGLGAASTSAGCTRPASERVEADRRVGKASGGGFDVRVAGGLAVVRHVNESELQLWLNAPVQVVHIKAGDAAPDQLRVSLLNAMPEAEASLVVNDSAPQPLELTAGTHPTRKTVTLPVQPGQRLQLRLGPADANDRGPWSFGLMSDVQEAIDEVEDIYAVINQEPVRFVLGAGDLTERGSRSELKRFERKLEALNVPYYATLGNHEIISGSPATFQHWFGRASSSFEFRGARFTLLDSASATLDPEVYEWLDAWLAAGKNTNHIVAMHIPPLDPSGVRNGAFGSRNEAAKLLTRLAEGKVDLTLYGHIHSQYSFDNAGIPAHISGGGGAIPERFDGIGRHFMVFEVSADGVQGSRVVRVD